MLCRNSEFTFLGLFHIEHRAARNASRQSEQTTTTHANLLPRTLSPGTGLVDLNGAASVSLWVSTAVMQATMALVCFSNNAWNVMISITGVMIPPAYIGATVYLWKLMAQGQYPAIAKIG